MIPRHHLLFSLALATALAGPAFGQPKRASHQPPRPTHAARAAHVNASVVPRTLPEALAATYANEPSLLAERAKLRATDENVPAALSGWRPTVVVAGSAGYGDGMTRSYSAFARQTLAVPTPRDIATAQATITQPIYNGGRTQANVDRAKNQVMAERANLIAQEQTSFQNSVNAYVGVIEAQQIVALDKNNVQVLTRQLQATRDRFRVGEITRTDVAQAEAALSEAQATLESDQGSLQSARGTYQQTIGFMPPENLVKPQPLDLPVNSEKEAAAVASTNNPQVVAAEFNDAAAKDAVNVAFSQLLPQVSLQGQVFQDENAAGRSSSVNGYQVTAQLSVPLYQGGSEYAAVRQAKQTQQQTRQTVDAQRRAATQAAVDAWDKYIAAKAAAASTRAAIRANEIALQGVEREAIVGSRTTLDVLNAQQTLLNSRTTLVRNLGDLVRYSYQVTAAIGRLTARDLHLKVPLYDDTAYYKAVKNRWVGLGDYATDQPNR